MNTYFSAEFLIQARAALAARKLRDKDLVKDDGIYIVIEGPDNVGKTTTISALVDRLNDRFTDKMVHSLREPGSTPCAEQLRNIVKNPDYDISPAVQTGLFSLARLDLLEQKVFPLLNRGDIVVSDRSFITTLTHEIIGNEDDFDVEDVVSWIRLAKVFRRFPDKIVVLNAEPETVIARANSRGMVKDRYDTNTEEGVRIQIDNYKAIKTHYNICNNIVEIMVDGLTTDEIVDKILSEVL